MSQTNDLYRIALTLTGDDRVAFLNGLKEDQRKKVEALLSGEETLNPSAAEPPPPPDAKAPDANDSAFAATHVGDLPNDPPSTAPLDAVDEPRTQIGPYKILQPIGKGGMGQVFMAEQTEPVRRRVALKVIKTDTPTKEILARFEAERQALAMMDHQNIAKVLDAGITEDGRPYFAMELVKGVPITEYCDKNRLTPNERLDLFVQTCRAIQHAHQKGIIHRDLKPGNVLVTLYDGKPVAKVIDFGLAKALQDTHKLTERTMFTQYGQVVGTLAYMSPEQAEMNALDVDTRTDVYSLGVILYELLTGSTPISRERIRTEAFDRILALIREEEVSRPSTRLSESGDAITGISDHRKTEPRRLSLILKGDLDWIAIKALEKDRTRRYDTPAALADDVQRYLSDEAIEARPPSLGYRMQKAVRKHKAAFAAGGTIVGLLVAGIVSTGVLWLRAASAERTALRSAVAERAARSAAVSERNRATGAERRTAAEKKRLAQSLARQLINVGVQKAATADYNGALPWLVSASDHSPDDASVAVSVATAQSYRCEGVFVHDARVNTAEWNSTEDQVATAGQDGFVRVWDAKSGRQISEFAHDDGVFLLAFNADSSQLLTVSRSSMLKVWKDGATVFEVQTDNPITDAVITEDGDILAAFLNGTVTIYDLVSEKPHRLKGVAQTGVSFAAVSSRGYFVVSGAEGIPLLGIVGSDESSAIEFADTTVRHVEFDPSATRVGFICDDNTVHIRSTKDAAKITTLSQTGCDKIQFSDDGRRIATIASSGSWFGETALIVWDCETGTALTPELRQETLITSAAFHPNGDTLLTAGTDESILLWNIDKAAIETQIYHQGHVMHAQFDREGERILSAGGLRREGYAQVVNVQSGVRRLPTGEHLQARVSNDGTKILTVPRPDAIKLWSVTSHQDPPITLKHSGPVVWADFSRGGSLLRTATATELFRWPEAPRTIADCDITPYSGRIVCLMESQADPSLVCALGQTVVQDELVGGVYSLTSIQNPARKRLMGSADEFYEVVSSPDGSILSGAGTDRSIRLWKTGAAEPDFLQHEPTVRLVLDVDISRDSAVLASAVAEWTGGGHVQLWNLDTNQRIGQPLRTAGYASNVALSADGQRVAAASNDRVAQVWDSRTGLAASAKFSHSASVDAVSLSNDGNLLLTASETTAFIWAVESDQLLARFDHDDDIVAVQFSAADSYAVIVAAKSVAVLPLSSPQTQQQLAAYSKLHAGRYVSRGGKVVALKPSELRELWLDGVSPTTIP